MCVYFCNQLFERTENLILVLLQLKKCDVEGKTKTVTGDGAAVFASQEDMSFMYPTAQSCQALPPKDNYPLGADSGLDMSCNGLAIGRAMDPSSRPHGYEFEGISGVGQVNKCRKEKKDDWAQVMVGRASAQPGPSQISYTWFKFFFLF